MEQEVKCKQNDQKDEKHESMEIPKILEEIEIEELAVDGICGIY